MILLIKQFKNVNRKLAFRVFRIFAVLLFIAVTAQAQQTSAGRILPEKEIAGIFTDSLKAALGLKFPVFRIYEYTDRSGLYYCVLTESRDSVTAKDTISSGLKAVNLRSEANGFTKVWELNDHIEALHNETSIWFWSKYIDFKDYDNDGLKEPVITYGTWGMNGYDDGRVKFIIYYKGQKIALRHQNGVLDDERDTRVDKTIYALPAALQQSVKEKMVRMTESGHALFPYGWQKALQQKRTFFSERGD
ncbi:M949_RS01915 family surface polysaccharide biosynthesis protein [Niabella beijingensis]|uniref:M949_RS01915 family surface polysaccharide biosynthesis protein n=1 Tax=Niabella beijingensis TaxID=2872700 RepID=UPI001CBFD757|nr:hypothetical protein [Niabella beijingensis]MBZ4189584.1 hypothetical protein [Niabella beijingensis]